MWYVSLNMISCLSIFMQMTSFLSSLPVQLWNSMSGLVLYRILHHKHEWAVISVACLITLGKYPWVLDHTIVLLLAEPDQKDWVSPSCHHLLSCFLDENNFDWDKSKCQFFFPFVRQSLMKPKLALNLFIAKNDLKLISYLPLPSAVIEIKPRVTGMPSKQSINWTHPHPFSVVVIDIFLMIKGTNFFQLFTGHLHFIFITIHLIFFFAHLLIE